MNDVSTTLRRHYGLELPDRVSDWLDARDDAPSAEALTAEAPPMIWPALMPCHLLPVVPVGQGDWLALRLEIDADAPARPQVDVVQWSHGGGDWVPWPLPGSTDVDVPAAVRKIAESPDDWSTAGQIAQTVAKRHPDLAWAHEIIGHSTGGRGHHAAAAIRCSSFTDQSVALQTHWSTSGADRPLKGAWAAGDVTTEPPPLPVRLGITTPLTKTDFDQYLAWVQRTPSRSAVTDFWLHQSETAGSRGDWISAMRAAWAAGWDVGGEPMGRYAVVLDRYILVADRGGFEAHHRVASAHRACLKQRFGL